MNKLNSCEQFERLINIIKKLRGEGGCPWDREQTSKSLIPYLLEETYEVIEAIEENNSDALKEELGDLTLHVLFQAEITAENGQFEIADSLKEICDKLVRRHPHVFGEKENIKTNEVLLNWETAKRKEKKRGNYLDGVPKNLPALTRARRIQEKASHVGFDWKEIEPIWAKVHEEIQELEEAFKIGDFEKIEEELGDSIFSMVNLGRFFNISSEEALRKTISKFETRFSGIEKKLKENNRSLEEATLEEMDAIWEEEKGK
ncbi:MAG: nucleoside triphosphate pyrophosphohydrolase [Candidatus Marinimicrobia bacterium]|nr:nucleoside triphosphate pyrophosphohydrolase [Candidatus Neomarinimicrobiota bacterium]MBL7022903.1 nucleoside triphosphate pyrophosphohydrolase [Candidatus Neomarinimicrobiota bacterium]MBL7109222.1 nucleoside triphosphate pyrophosphohydrolase [Candidatus Neomarinimicrobiota bacterium]